MKNFIIQNGDEDLLNEQLLIESAVNIQFQKLIKTHSFKVNDIFTNDLYPYPYRM